MIISGERQISYDDIRARIRRAMSGFRALGLAEAAPVAMMLRNDFALFEVVAASAALGSPVVPINWHLKAEEVRYILADSGAKILVCHADLLPQIRDGVPADVLLLVVATPPELAADLFDPWGTDRDPGGTDRLGPLARRPSASAGAAAAGRSDDLYIRHHGHAEGRAAHADAARTGGRLRTRGRDRLWHQAAGRPNRADQRPDVSLGAAFLRHAGVPQRLHHHPPGAVRCRGAAGADRAPPRHAHSHGTDHVRPAAAVARSGQAALRPVVAAFRRARRRPLPRRTSSAP
ncbi:hypothetical protein ACVWXL_006713 [Bradyrhizobium sp. GM22.5]